MATRQTKTKAPYVPTIPLVVIFGHSVESASKIKEVLAAYGILSIAAQAGTLDELTIRVPRITVRNPTIGLIVLELEGFEDPALPIKIAKGCEMPVIGLAPLRKNKGSQLINFSEFGIAGFQSQHINCLRQVASLARKLLKITAPVDETALEKFIFSGELSAEDVGSDDQDYPPKSPPVPKDDGRLSAKGQPVPVLTMPPQGHNLPPLPKPSVTPRAKPIPPVTRLLAKNPPESQPKGENIMPATTPRDISAIAKNLEIVLSDLSQAAADARACLNEMEDVATMLCEGGKRLFQEIKGPTNMEDVKKAKAPKNARTVEQQPIAGAQKKSVKHRSKEKQEFLLAGKRIVLSGSTAKVLTKLAAEPKKVFPTAALIEAGATKHSVDVAFNVIRGRLKKTFGEKGRTALVTHQREGHSFDPTLLQ